MSSNSLYVLMFSVVLLLSCRKDNNDIPYVSFDFTININEPSFFDLQAVGGHETVVGGSLGIILYRNSFEEFTALERHSPYNAEDNCQVVISDDGVTLKDPCSGSEWLIIDGSLLTGPATRSLLQYKTIFNDPYLRVYN